MVHTPAAAAATSRARPISRVPPSASATRARAPTTTDTDRLTRSFATGSPTRTTGPGSSIRSAAAPPPIARAASSASRAATMRVPVPIRRGAGPSRDPEGTPFSLRAGMRGTSGNDEGDARRTAHPLLVVLQPDSAGGGLQLAAGADLDTLAGGDLDRLTRLRVAAGASGPGGLLDGEPTGDRHLGALSHALGERGEERVENAVDGGLRLAGLRRDGGDEIGAVQRCHISPPWDCRHPSRRRPSVVSCITMGAGKPSGQG